MKEFWKLIKDRSSAPENVQGHFFIRLPGNLFALLTGQNASQGGGDVRKPVIRDRIPHPE